MKFSNKQKHIASAKKKMDKRNKPGLKYKDKVANN